MINITVHCKSLSKNNHLKYLEVIWCRKVFDTLGRFSEITTGSSEKMVETVVSSICVTKMTVNIATISTITAEKNKHYFYWHHLNGGQKYSTFKKKNGWKVCLRFGRPVPSVWWPYAHLVPAEIPQYFWDSRALPLHPPASFHLGVLAAK